MVLGADRRVIGILFERDIVRTFAEFGSDAPTKGLGANHDPRGRDLWRDRYGGLQHEADDRKQSPTQFRWLTGIGWSHLGSPPAGSKHTIFPCMRIQ